MRAKEQLKKYVGKAFECLRFYLLMLVLVIVAFGAIYQSIGIDRPFVTSLSVLAGMENETVSGVLFSCFWIEKMLKNIVDLYIVAWLVSKILSPVCPMVFSKYAVYNSDRNALVFRYWIMRRRNKFLYDAKIRISVVLESELNKDESILKNTPDDEQESITFNIRLARIRGIRYIEIPKKEYDNFKQKPNEDSLKEKRSIIVSILAHDENGKTFAERKIYDVNKILSGYEFAPVKNEKYCVGKYKDALKKQHVNIKDAIDREESFANYQNFDMVYKLEDKGNKHFKGKPESCDELTYEEVFCGKKRGFKLFLSDITNALTWYTFDWDGKRESRIEWKKSNKKYKNTRKEIIKENRRNKA